VSEKTTWTLPASWYHDEQIWQRERARIFAREWLWLGREDQLAEPGAVIAGELAGFPVLVVRNADGLVRAALDEA
jgi:phenylpropionate dioxygenase-like ring-hydroxylating dioxygenase large terminal subunit